MAIACDPIPGLNMWKLWVVIIKLFTLLTVQVHCSLEVDCTLLRLHDVQLICPAGCTCCIYDPLPPPLHHGAKNTAVVGGTLSVDCSPHGWDTGNPTGEVSTSGFEAALSEMVKAAAGHNITTLQVRNSRLQNVSALHLCNWPELAAVYLDHNEITELGSLSCLKGLKSFSAENNEIVEITNLTFYQLDELTYLNLNANAIEDAGLHPHAFTGLISLTSISLSRNRLMFVGIWPLYLLVNSRSYIIIYLDYNMIFQTIDDLAPWWSYNCSMDPAHGFLSLRQNRISNLDGMLYIYNPNDNIVPEYGCLYEDGQFAVDLKDNPFQCDCCLFPYVSFMKHLRKRGFEVPDTSCRLDTTLKSVFKVTPQQFSCTQSVSSCRITVTPYTATVRMDCHNVTMCHWPAIPDQAQYDACPGNADEYQYELHFANNQLQNFLNQYWLESKNISTADLSHNWIDAISPADLEHLLKVKNVYLHGNQILNLPSKAKEMDFGLVENLTLHRNNWSCSCENSWFPEWLNRGEITAKLGGKSRLKEIVCYSPSRLANKPIYTLTRNDMCVENLLLEVFLGVLASLVAVALSVALVYRSRVWLYATLQWHPFDLDECEGEGKEYDVFVSYATDDEPWVMDLVENLERSGYRALFHRRDFVAGMYMTENVARAVRLSKRTVCVVSPNFLLSPWCKWEFLAVYNDDICDNKRRLILLIKDEVPLEELSLSMQQYLRHYTYVNSRDRHYKRNLLYSLPVNKLGPRDQVPDQQDDVTRWNQKATAKRTGVRVPKGKPRETKINFLKEGKRKVGEDEPLLGSKYRT